MKEKAATSRRTPHILACLGSARALVPPFMAGGPRSLGVDSAKMTAIDGRVSPRSRRLRRAISASTVCDRPLDLTAGVNLERYVDRSDGPIGTSAVTESCDGGFGNLRVRARNERDCRRRSSGRHHPQDDHAAHAARQHALANGGDGGRHAQFHRS